MIKKIAVVIVILIVAFLAYAATRPDTFRIQRQATIQAPPEKIFPLIDDFHQWRAWSPWENVDPDMRRTYSGPASGEGAVYGWEGNQDIGSGRMEIIEATPPSRVLIKLEFFEPFEAENRAEFTLQPEGDATRVTWAMDGTNNFVGKVLSVLIDMDSMVGEQFEIGLANMKKITEG